jgi:hypothetical protein
VALGAGVSASAANPSALALAAAAATMARLAASCRACSARTRARTSALAVASMVLRVASSRPMAVSCPARRWRTASVWAWVTASSATRARTVPVARPTLDSARRSWCSTPPATPVATGSSWMSPAASSSSSGASGPRAYRARTSPA